MVEGRNIRTGTDRCGIFTATKEMYSGSSKINRMQW
jgi:hypothetical protein